MNATEKLFFMIYGIVIFPLLLLYLVINHLLSETLVSPLLTFMASISGVYLGARSFDMWNSTPDNPPLDDGGH